MNPIEKNLHLVSTLEEAHQLNKRLAWQRDQLYGLLKAYDAAVEMTLDDDETPDTPQINVLTHFSRAAQRFASCLMQNKDLPA